MGLSLEEFIAYVSQREVLSALGYSICMLCVFVLAPVYLVTIANRAHHRRRGNALPGPPQTDTPGGRSHLQVFLNGGGDVGDPSPYLKSLHSQYGPIARFWLDEKLWVSIAHPAWACALLDTENERTNECKKAAASFLGKCNLFSMSNAEKDPKSKARMIRSLLKKFLDEKAPVAFASAAATSAGQFAHSHISKIASANQELDAKPAADECCIRALSAALCGEDFYSKHGQQLATQLTSAAEGAQLWGTKGWLEKALSQGYWTWRKACFKLDMTAWNAVAEVLTAEQEAKALHNRGQGPVTAPLTAGRGVDLIGWGLHAKTNNSGYTILESRVALNHYVLGTFFGGYQPMATTLAWALYELARNTEAQSRAAQEVREVCQGKAPAEEHLPQLAYLRAVLWEVLRLYPPSPMLIRVISNDLMIGEHTVPSNATVVIPVRVIQKDPKIWGKDAEAFNPARFERPAAARQASSEGEKSRDQNTERPTYIEPQGKETLLLAFGSGKRACPGRTLALLQLPLLLASILQEWELGVSPGQGSIEHVPVGLTSGPVPSPQLLVSSRK